MITIEDIIGGIGGALNGINQSVMALSFGFAMLPSVLAYIVGIIGCLVFKSAVPISFQAETIVMAGTMGKDKKERLSIVLYAGLVMTLIGAVGILDNVIAFAGIDITSAMMAGVGLVLCKICFDMVKGSPVIGFLSVFSAISTYLLTMDVGYACIIPILVCAVAAKVMKKEEQTEFNTVDKFELHKPTFNLNILRGTLSLICITIGGNIATAGIASSMSGMESNPNHISVYSGVADAISSLFGGAPISVVISPSSAAPNPVISGVILMSVMAILLASKQLPKVIKLIPTASVAGVLFVLGGFLTLPPNLAAAYADGDASNTLACSVTLAVTAVFDPFVGMAAGIIVKGICSIIGI